LAILSVLLLPAMRLVAADEQDRRTSRVAGKEDAYP